MNADIYRTNDGSVGLYNKEIKDIYHASSGACTESIEKFIRPANFERLCTRKKEIKILDICYGIGYNTKTAINEINKWLSKIANIEINVENFENDRQKTTLQHVQIDALENYQSLVVLSGLLKYTNLPNCVNALICDFIFAQITDWATCTEKFESDSDLRPYLSNYLLSYLKYHDKNLLKDALIDFKSILHNIYYHYVSMRNKIDAKAFKTSVFDISFHINDARKTVRSLSGLYDLIFLDAFSPKLSPQLWTFDFLKELYRLADYDCMLLTYSNAITIRSALNHCGFYIGKNLSEQGKSLGTIASKNPDLIVHPLSEYELGLFDTTGGIFYRDENLSLSDGQIIFNREKEKSDSDLPSTSRYIKSHGRKKSCTT